MGTPPPELLHAYFKVRRPQEEGGGSEAYVPAHRAVRGAGHKVADVHLAGAVPEGSIADDAHKGLAQAAALRDAFKGAPDGPPRGSHDQLIGVGNQRGPPVQGAEHATRRAN